MPSIFQRKGFRICRVCFRWFRIVVLLLVLTVVCAFIYLNQVGLPGRVKRALVAELRARGVEFQFEKMRLDFYGGIVAEKVVVERMGEPDSPRVLVERVGLQLNPAALLDFRLAVDSLSLRGGRLVVPLGATNVPGEFTVEGIEAEVAFLPGDRWQVEGLRARCLGARFQLAGWVDHASDFSQWKFAEPAATATNLPPRDWRAPFRDVVEAAARMKFAVPPLIKGRLRADGREPMRAHARLEIESGGAETPWGNAERLRMTVTSHPATNRGAIIGGEITLRLEGARTPWGSATELELESQAWPFDRAGRWRGADFKLHAIAPDSKWGRAKEVTVVSKANAQQQIGNLPSANLDVRATGPDTPWGRARSLHLTLATGEMATNLAGMSATLELSTEDPETPWGKAASTWLQARVWKRPTPTIPATNAALGDWNKILPYELKWKLRGESVVRPELTVDQLAAEGHWRAPDLRIDKVEASVLGGKLASSAQLDIATRALQAGVSVDFDVKKLDRLLGTNTQQWLAQLSWDQPPVVTAQAGLTLPPWTNAQPDWKSVVPSLWLRGALTNEAGNFRGIGFDRLRLDFSFTNYVWHLTDLVLNRRGARLDLEHTSDERTRDHWWRIAGDVHLMDLKPLFGNGADRALGFFKFNGPTHLDGELWGRWGDLDRYGARATVRATNWSFRGEQMSELAISATYTNRNLQFRDVRLVRPEGQLTLAAGSFDLPTLRVHLTNGLSTIEPGSVLRPIGPETARTMAPYQFGLPPTVTVNGFICVTNIAQVDLRFGIAGGPFHWTRFNLPAVTADAHWHNDSLELTNLNGVFYDGKITGYAHFDFNTDAGTEFSFLTDIWETDLKKMLTDITLKTNSVEGVLNGRLVITSANTTYDDSWNGYGHASLRDGLLWDSPLFGFMSAPLNLLSPGLGNSRARAATNTFTLTNSLIHTDDLDIYTPVARLKYRGTVDFQTRVNARVEAEVLRDTPLFGVFFKVVLTPLTKILEYKVGGTIADPKTQPLYFLPKLILIPLSPFKTLRDLFGEEDKEKPAPPAVTSPAPVPAPPPAKPQP